MRHALSLISSSSRIKAGRAQTPLVSAALLSLLTVALPTTFLPLLCQPALAEAPLEPLDELVEPSSVPFSVEANIMADTLKISNDLQKLKQSAQPGASDGALLRALLLKQSITETIVTESFEVRSCLSNLEVEIAQADDLQAILEERRDKVIRLNTIANFLSGGITGIVGGSIKIAEVNEQAANGIDTGEGITQTALALLALKQQAGEKKIVEGTPNMLAKLFDVNAPHTERDYPPSVWRYLCSVPPGSKTSLTRREELIKRWMQLKVISRKTTTTQKKDVVGHLTGTKQQTLISIDLLDARSAMLHDVRAVVSEMDHPLLELMHTVRGVKLN